MSQVICIQFLISENDLTRDPSACSAEKNETDYPGSALNQP